MKLFSVFIGFICLISCSTEQNPNVGSHIETTASDTNTDNVDSSAVLESSSYTFEVFETPALGWGYKIFDDGTVFINQPHIPAIPGNKGFSTKKKAEITAQFAILKMEQGFVPPTISPEELDSLGVLN